MKTVSLSGSLRQSVGTKDAKALRAQDLVPCVMYGGETQKHFTVRRLDLNKLIYTPDVYKIELDLDGEKFETIVKEVQFHPVNDRPIHTDFIELADGRPVKVELPARLLGNALGVRNGGKLMQHFRKLKVKALPGEMPELISIDIEKLRIGQKIRISDVAAKFPGLEFLHPEQAVIVAIKTARGAVDEDEEEEGEAEAAAEAPAEG